MFDLKQAIVISAKLHKKCFDANHKIPTIMDIAQNENIEFKYVDNFNYMNRIHNQTVPEEWLDEPFVLENSKFFISNSSEKKIIYLKNCTRLSDVELKKYLTKAIASYFYINYIDDVDKFDVELKKYDKHIAWLCKYLTMDFEELLYLFYKETNSYLFS